MTSKPSANIYKYIYIYHYNRGVSSKCYRLIILRLNYLWSEIPWLVKIPRDKSFTFLVFSLEDWDSLKTFIRKPTPSLCERFKCIKYVVTKQLASEASLHPALRLCVLPQHGTLNASQDQIWYIAFPPFYWMQRIDSDAWTGKCWMRHQNDSWKWRSEVLFLLCCSRFRVCFND